MTHEKSTRIQRKMKMETFLRPDIVVVVVVVFIIIFFFFFCLYPLRLLILFVYARVVFFVKKSFVKTFHIEHKKVYM